MAATRKRRRKLNTERAREKSEELDSRSTNEFHDLKQGANYFFLLPPWDDDIDVIWHEVMQHQRGVCPKQAKNKSCAVCKERTKRMKKGDTDWADKYRLRSRAFFNAIRKEKIKEKDPANVLVLGCSPTVFQEILDYISDEDIDISDPEAAVPICIRRKGEGLKTRYKVRFGDPVDISRYITDEIMEALWPLNNLRSAQPMTEKEQRKMIRGDADEDDGFDEDSGFDDDDLDGDGDGDTAESSEEDDLFEGDDGDEGWEDGDEGGEDGDDLDDLLGEEDGDDGDDEPPRSKKTTKKVRRTRRVRR